ncbi:PREDICTED: transducin-like enhancer protein 1, partial [Buceros rhinoceros silvestris]|uniref:transducin-like enhancer protein 1 n=1 Tax=Buceros rhinoceros silvestris TaxID=175836 RepID=UPI0005283F9E
LKLECEKLASEKTEMQRHYVMYYEMSYGLNIEMHKQTEIAKRLNTICAQVIPFLSQEHQQQVAQAVERAKQVTMAELNAIIGVRGLPGLPPTRVQRPEGQRAMMGGMLPQEHQVSRLRSIRECKKETDHWNNILPSVRQAQQADNRHNTEDPLVHFNQSECRDQKDKGQ